MSAAPLETTSLAPQTASVPAARWDWPFLALLAALWTWAIGIDAPFWQTNPDYSYGFIVPVLMVFYLWKRLGQTDPPAWQVATGGPVGRRGLNPWLLAVPALGLFPLEVYRIEYFQSGVVLWVINLATVGFTLAGAWWLGGRRLLATVAFPVLFFLTAVPWPAKIATPVQQALMTNVAQVVSEMLLWLGVPVQLDGAVLHLTKGPVGIVEACSGIRSLQSGLMVSLAVGELLWLTRRRRIGLVAFAVLLALTSNLVRTFTLCWIMEKGGGDAMHKAHDMVGNIAMYSLYALIYGVGKLLEPRGGAPWPEGSGGPWKARLAGLRWTAVPELRPLLAASTLMFAVVHGWYHVLTLQVKPQTTPYFTAKIDKTAGTEKQPFDEQVWGRLGATEGEQVRHRTSTAPAGFVDAYHLFWRPSPMSKTALHHRPDICMPGSGWKQVGDVETVEASLDGRPLRWLLFRFEKSDLKALQLWGVWRNGEPVEMDYSARISVLPEKYHPFPSARHLMGVELVSVFLPYRGDAAPKTSTLTAMLPQLFTYRPPETPAK